MQLYCILLAAIGILSSVSAQHSGSCTTTNAGSCGQQGFCTSSEGVVQCVSGTKNFKIKDLKADDELAIWRNSAKLFLSVRGLENNVSFRMEGMLPAAYVESYFAHRTKLTDDGSEPLSSTQASLFSKLSKQFSKALRGSEDRSLALESVEMQQKRRPNSYWRCRFYMIVPEYLQK
jgi:hypothetical protein